MELEKPQTAETKINPNDIARRLDNLEWSRWHTKLTTLLAIGWAFDAFEVSIVSAVLSNLKAYFEISPEQAGIITTVWLMGALVGAISFGYFTDRFGRKLAFVVTIVGYSIMSIITAFSFHFYFFLVFRFLTAVGVGAEYVAVNATVAEFIPARHRGKANTAVIGLWCVGALLANAVQYAFLTLIDKSYSWRIGFALGGTAAIFVMVARKSLPESPRWLLVQGRYKEADELLQEIENMAGQPDNKHSLEKLVNEVEYKAHEKYSFLRNLKEIFCNYPFRVAFGCVLNASQAFADYGESNLMSLAVLPDVGIVDGQVAMFYLYGVICTVPGFIVVSFLIDVTGRKLLLPIVYIFAILSVSTFIPAYWSQDPARWMTAAHCCYQFFYTAASMVIYSSLTEAFPTHLRATGIGLAVACGRAAAALAPIIVIPIFFYTGNSSFKVSPEVLDRVINRKGNYANIVGASSAIMGLFGLGLIMSIFWAIFGVEGKNRSLEDMNTDTAITADPNSKEVAKASSEFDV